MTVECVRQAAGTIGADSRWQRGADWLIIALYALLVYPCTAQYLNCWDAANYALAAEEYNVLFDRPQMPGYVVYVGLGKIAGLIAGEINRGFILLNWCLGALAVWSFLRLGAALAVRHRQWWALVLITLPQVWYFSAVAWMYVVHLLVSLGAIRALLAISRNEHQLLAATSLGALGALRPDMLPLLLVLTVVAWWLGPRRSLMGAAASIVIILLVTGLWLLPLVMVYGRAYFTYSAVYSRQYLDDAAGWQGVILNNLTALHPAVTASASMFVLAALAVMAVRPAAVRNRPAVVIAGGLAAAQVLFLLAVHTGNGGHLLRLTGPLLLLTAMVLSSVKTRWQIMVLLVAVAGNGAFFLGSSRAYTWRDIQRNDRVMAGRMAWLAQHTRPGSTLLIADLSYKQLLWYTRGYRLIWPVNAGQRVPLHFIVRGADGREQHCGRYLYDDHADNCEPVPAGTIVVFMEGHLAGQVRGIEMNHTDEIAWFCAARPLLLVFQPGRIMVQPAPGLSAGESK